MNTCNTCARRVQTNIFVPNIGPVAVQQCNLDQRLRQTFDGNNHFSLVVTFPSIADDHTCAEYTGAKNGG